MDKQRDDTESLWTARPLAAWAIRAFVFLAPLSVSILVAWLLGQLAPRPTSFTLGVIRWFVIAVASTFVLIAVDKAARRLLPLATLFGLTLAFPDQAPSRFQLALRRGSTAQLRIRIAEARAGKLGDTPEEAAERVLELVMALSLHDRLTRGHSERVRAYTQMVGEEMRFTPRELDRLRWAGLLHDIGKLMVSAEILNKPGKLTDVEFDTIKRHPEFGRELVAPLIDWLGEAARAVWEHHERWDGNGYPRGLVATDISLAGRIVSVADAYDVMTSARSYQQPVSPAAARAELTRCSGTHFDPAVVRAFMNVSLGRLRFAAGPLSWLAQVPLFPTAVGATAGHSAATAATALVGAAAASMGLGLAGEPVLPSPRDAVVEATAAATQRDPIDAETGRRTSIAGMPVHGGTPGPDDASDGTDRPDDPTVGAGTVAATTTPTATSVETNVSTTVAGGTPTTTVDDPTPDRPGRDVSPPTTDRAATTTTTPGSAVTTTVAPTTTGAPGTTIAPTTTTAVPTTTAATTTTTIPPRPPWLPPAGVATAFYLELPASVDLASGTPLALKLPAPTRTNALSFDPDHDGRAGVTLRRTSGTAVAASDQAVFAWGGPAAFRTAGSTSAVVHATIDSILPGQIVVRGRLLSCDAASTCTVVAETSATAFSALLALPMNLDFGAIDAVVPANGTLRLTVDVPSTSGAGVLLLADTTATPGAITLTMP